VPAEYAREGLFTAAASPNSHEARSVCGVRTMMCASCFGPKTPCICAVNAARRCGPPQSLTLILEVPDRGSAHPSRLRARGLLWSHESCSERNVLWGDGAERKNSELTYDSDACAHRG
jgi:hypothetical protein